MNKHEAIDLVSIIRNAEDRRTVNDAWERLETGFKPLLKHLCRGRDRDDRYQEAVACIWQVVNRPSMGQVDDPINFLLHCGKLRVWTVRNRLHAKKRMPTAEIYSVDQADVDFLPADQHDAIADYDSQETVNHIVNLAELTADEFASLDFEGFATMEYDRTTRLRAQRRLRQVIDTSPTGQLSGVSAAQLQPRTTWRPNGSDGTSFHKSTKRWRARARYQGHNIFIGSYATKVEALRGYQEFSADPDAYLKKKQERRAIISN